MKKLRSRRVGGRYQNSGLLPPLEPYIVTLMSQVPRRDRGPDCPFPTRNPRLGSRCSCGILGGCLHILESLIVIYSLRMIVLTSPGGGMRWEMYRCKDPVHAQGSDSRSHGIQGGVLRIPVN